MPRKKKAPDVTQLIQTHGALQAPRSVAEISGQPGPYKAKTYDEYRTEIKAMTVIDLHDHAYDVGVTPIDPRERLEDNLEKKYLAEQTKNLYRVVPTTLSPEAADRQRRIMAGEYRP